MEFIKNSGKSLVFIGKKNVYTLDFLGFDSMKDAINWLRFKYAHFKVHYQLQVRNIEKIFVTWIINQIKQLEENDEEYGEYEDVDWDWKFEWDDGDDDVPWD